MIGQTSNLSTGYVARKLLHILLNGSLGVIAFFLPKDSVMPLVVSVFTGIFLFELIRLKTSAKGVVHSILHPVLKRREKKGFSGVFWAALAAMLLSFFAGPKALAFGFGVFAVGDALAALVGRGVSSRKLYRFKTVAGSATFFISALLVTIVYFSLVPIEVIGGVGPRMWVIALLMALVLTIIELFSYPLDDNFTILFFASLFMHFLLTV